MSTASTWPASQVSHRDSPPCLLIPTSTSSLQGNRIVLPFAVKFGSQPRLAPELLSFHIVSRPLHLNPFLFISLQKAVPGQGPFFSKLLFRAFSTTLFQLTRVIATLTKEDRGGHLQKRFPIRNSNPLCHEPAPPLRATTFMRLLICGDRRCSPIK